MLERQDVHLQLDGGIDTKTDPKQLDAVKMATVQDGVFTTPRKVSKRKDYSVLTTNIQGGGTLSNAQQIASRNSGAELVQIANNALYSYSPALTQWSQMGTLYPIKYNQLPVPQSQPAQFKSSSSVAVAGNILVSCVVNNGLYASVQDLNTGTYITPSKLLGASGATIYGTATIGTNVFVIYIFNSNLYGWILDTTNPAAGWTQKTLTTSNDVYTTVGDISVFNSQIYIAYPTTPAGSAVKVGAFNTTLTQVGTWTSNVISILNLLSIGPVALVLDSANSRFYCFYATLSGTGPPYLNTISYFVINSALTITVTAAALTIPSAAGGGTGFGPTIFTGSVSGGICTLFTSASGGATTGLNYTMYAVLNAGTIVTNLTVSFFHLAVQSKVFTVNGVNFINLCRYTFYDPQLITMSFSTFGGTVSYQLVGRAMYGTYAPDSFGQPVVVSNTVYLPVGRLVSESANSNISSLVSPVLLKAVFSDATTQFPVGQTDNNLLIGAGLLLAYDGANLFENSFLYPNVISSSSGSTTGGNMAAGVYQYRTTLEYVDANGQLHRSSPSQPVTVTIASGTTGSASLGIDTYNLPGIMAQNAYIIVWRTLANGGTFYQVNNPGTLLNTLATATVSFSDTYADATINTSPILYTNGNIAPNEQMDFVTQMESFKNRMFIVSDDPNAALFSKSRVTGEPTDFNEAFSVSCEQGNGNNTAMKAMDDKMIFFKSSHPYVMFGDPPDDTGANSTFTTPQVIQAPAGCDYHKAIGTLPDGIIFKSKTMGFWKLDRSLNASYIGFEVEAYNAYDVTSAVSVPGTNQVRFTLSNGTALVYDYLVNKWCVFSGISAIGAAVWNNQYCYLDTAGVVHVESASYTNAISMQLQTGWIHLAQLQGFQRIRKVALLGDYYSGHTLTVKVGYDYESAFNETHTITPDSVVNVAPNNDVYQFEFRPLRQKCEAIRFQIYDTATGAPGAGYSISGVDLEVGVKSGTMKLPATKKFG